MRGGSCKGTYVVLPADIVEGDRIDVLVKDEGDGDGEVEHVETLRADGEGQDFNGIRHDERGECQTALPISNVT